MQSREMRELSDEQLLELYEDKKESMYRLRQNHASGELKDTSEIRNTRRDVARILTILRERELAAELTGEA